MSVNILGVLCSLRNAYLAFHSVETFGVMLCGSIDWYAGSMRKEVHGL
jgi:hypothetical protein